MYLVEISKTAYKALSKLPNSIAEKIEDAILALEENPRLQKSKKLVGFKDLCRIRVIIEPFIKSIMRLLPLSF